VQAVPDLVPQSGLPLSGLVAVAVEANLDVVRGVALSLGAKRE
jgi:hypothetical protein